MVFAISQETFDEAVKENIKEFEMTPEEATKEAVEQFQAQGVDLSNIVTDEMTSGSIDSHAITAAIKALKTLNTAESLKTPPEYIEQLNSIKTECDKGLQYKVLAGKEGAYNLLLDTLFKHENNLEVTKECLKTLISLMTKQPDLLDEKGVETIISYLDKQKDSEVQRLILKWTKECCVMHEMNRQQIFDAAILDHLKPLLDDASAALLRDVLGVLRALILDDDVRVEFGRAHEHARHIASDTLCSITGLLTKFRTDEPLMNDVMLTLAALLVRTEFCKKVEDAGGLELIKNVLVDFHDNDKLTRQCFKLLKALCGNDECKLHIISKGLAPVITSSLNHHKSSALTAIAGLSCVASLSLRMPDNSKALFEAGIADVIVECMKLHPDNEVVQKNGSWAIRNMVSRSRYQNARFLELGAESILKRDLKKFTKFEYDMKAALRDLGCQVNLKEEWTGKGGLLSSQSKN